MKENSLIRTLIGGVIITFGSLWLLQNIGVLDFNYWAELWGAIWGLVIVVAGMLVITRRSGVVWGIILMVFGGSIILRSLHLVSFGFWRIFLPTVMIAVGASIIVGISRSQKRLEKESKTDSKAGKASHVDKELEMVSFFSGNQEKVNGEYNGGQVSAVFGGATIDLRKAKIDGEVTIDVFIICGGIKLILPEDVTVCDKIHHFMGGTDDKSNPAKDAKKVLNLVGSCSFGGIEII